MQLGCSAVTGIQVVCQHDRRSICRWVKTTQLQPVCGGVVACSGCDPMCILL